MPQYITKKQYESVINGPENLLIYSKELEEVGQFPLPNIPIDIVSGRFNPLHKGHEFIYNNIESPFRYYEISISHDNKRELSIEEINSILGQFKNRGQVIVSNLPKFSSKAAIYHEYYNFKINFHVGIDVAYKILTDEDKFHIEYLSKYKDNIEFYVYNREEEPDITNIKWPTNFFFRSIVPEDIAAISSTKLRESDDV